MSESAIARSQSEWLIVLWITKTSALHFLAPRSHESVALLAYCSPWHVDESVDGIQREYRIRAWITRCHADIENYPKLPWSNECGITGVAGIIISSFVLFYLCNARQHTKEDYVAFIRMQRMREETKKKKKEIIWLAASPFCRIVYWIMSLNLCSLVINKIFLADSVTSRQEESLRCRTNGLWMKLDVEYHW